MFREDVFSMKLKKEDILDGIKNNQKLIALIIFCLISVLMIVLSVCVVKISVVAVCLLVIVEAGIATLLHNAEVWIHGVFAIAEIIAGALLNNILLVVFCIVVYVATLFTLKFIYSGEKING